MSLTTEITNLTSQVTQLTQRVDGWVSDADARITAAVQAIPKLSERIYVHPAGNDAASGAADDPVATVAEAVRRMPASGQLEVYLQGDVVIDTPIDARHLLRLVILGDGQRRVLGFGNGYQPFWDGYRLDGLVAKHDLMLINLDIQYPSTTASPPTDRPVVHTGLINMINGRLELWGCTISGTAPSVPLERHVISAPGFYTDIVFGGGTSWSSGLASHLISGLAAGSDPNALPNLRSNITMI